jgi:hypothetical protein
MALIWARISSVRCMSLPPRPPSSRTGSVSVRRAAEPLLEALEPTYDRAATRSLGVFLGLCGRKVVPEAPEAAREGGAEQLARRTGRISVARMARRR